MTAHQPDPAYVAPTITVSVTEVAKLAGLLIGAQEYLEALERVAMIEGRQRPGQLGDLRLARDVLVQWVARRDWVSAGDCTCPKPLGAARQAHCLVHDFCPEFCFGVYPCQVAVAHIMHEYHGPVLDDQDLTGRTLRGFLKLEGGTIDLGWQSK